MLLDPGHGWSLPLKLDERALGFLVHMSPVVIKLVACWSGSLKLNRALRL
jgi:hypothetical protein